MLDKKTLAKIKAYFKKQPDVVAVYLYGSQTRSSANVLSDIDIAVLLEDKTKDKFDRRLEFISSVQNLIDKEVDIKLLNDDYSLGYLQAVLNEGKAICVKNRESLFDFKNKIYNLYLDFRPVLNAYYQAMYKRLEGRNYATV